MKEKWNHSERPFKYEVYSDDGELMFSGAFNDAMKFMEDNKNEYIIVDWDRPHGHERLPSKPILLEKKEAEDLNKMLTLNGENKRYIKL